MFVPVIFYLLFATRIRQLFRPRATTAKAAQTNFILLVPAHNEAELLPSLLASITQLKYPASRFCTVVVADNCTDTTAQLARQAGAQCLERTTAYPSNKSQALRYAAEQLGLKAPYSATVVCVLDADCRLDPQFLAELDAHFAQPGAAPVVQCHRRVANAFESDVTVLDAASEAMRQHVLLGARQLLGLEVFIYGLGCCLREEYFAQVLAQPVISLAEDKEWKAYLAAAQVPVAYCAPASVSYQTVRDGAAFSKQRQRWLAGQFASARAHGLPLLAQGLRRGRLSQLDFACDLLQPPRSLLLVAALVFGAVAALAPAWALVGTWVWLALAVCLFAYGALGLRLVGAAPRHFLALFSGVRLIGDVTKSVLLVVTGHKEKEWKATR
ncbi:MAG: glycosyltransferase family 2 protein [Janthinobacterium lividum]